MDEVGRRAKIGRKFRVIFDRFQRGRRDEISMLTDQPIDGRILSKIFYSGREDNQFGAVGKCHSRPIDGLIPKPRTLRFIRMKVHNSLLYFRIERENIDLETQLRSSLEAFLIIAYEEPPYRQSPVLVSPHYG